MITGFLCILGAFPLVGFALADTSFGGALIGLLGLNLGLSGLVRLLGRLGGSRP